MEEQTIFDTREVGIFSKRLEFEINENDFKCPETGEFVNVEYCESIALDKGCKYLGACRAYNTAKRRG